MKKTSKEGNVEETVFISHHNSDAEQLSKLRENFSSWGYKIFLAQYDIENQATNYLTYIQKKIKDYDIFLFLMNEETEKSPSCNQELGIAIGLNKKIILALKEGTEAFGFLQTQQAYKYTEINESFFYNFLENFPSKYRKEKKEAKLIMEIENLKFFKKIPEIKERNSLIFNNWNDYNYYTTCELYLNYNFVAEIKLAHKDFDDLPEDVDSKKPSKVSSKDGKNIKDFLTDEITILDKNFFSRIFFSGSEVSSEIREAISCYFNDIETFCYDNKHLDKTVTIKSLFRYEDDRIKKLANKYKNKFT